MSRLRHKRIRPHSGPARHLNPPYSHARRHGGRAHLKAEGPEAHERRDRKSRRKHRDDGGPVNAAMANQAMANSAMSNAMANQSSGTPLSVAQQYALQGGRKSGGGKWIQGAIKHKGALHRALHVPEGEKIPAKKMAKAAHSENPRVRRMANLAKTLKGLH